MEMMNKTKAEAGASGVTQKQAKKAEQAKAYKAKQAQLKEERVKIAKETLEYIEKNKIKLPENSIDMLTKLAHPNDRTAIAGSFLERVFSGSPKVGDKITLREYLEKTLESKHKLDSYVKLWAARGIIIEFTDNKAAPLDSYYTITKLPL